MTKKVITAVIIIAAIVLAVICYTTLPDQVVVRTDADGQPLRTFSKPVTILAALAICVLGAFRFYDSERGTGFRGIIFSIAGFLIFLVAFVRN